MSMLRGMQTDMPISHMPSTTLHWDGSTGMAAGNSTAARSLAPTANDTLGHMHAMSRPHGCEHAEVVCGQHACIYTHYGDGFELCGALR